MTPKLLICLTERMVVLFSVLGENGEGQGLGTVKSLGHNGFAVALKHLEMSGRRMNRCGTPRSELEIPHLCGLGP